MVEAVRDAGLDPATYNDIGQAARTNPELQKKIDNMQ